MPSNYFQHRCARLWAMALSLCAICGADSALSAQISSRPEAVPFLLDQQVQRSNYNIRLGPVMLDLIGTFGIEYDDNVNTSENNELEDIILQPGLSFGAKWQFSEFNELSLSVGAEYWKYLKNSELDENSKSFSVSPDTELSFRVVIGEVVVRVYDRLQYDISSTDSIGYTVSGGTATVNEQDPGLFPRFTNTLGAQSEWYIDKTRFGAQVSRKDVWSTESVYDYINRVDYDFLLNADRQLASNFTLGLGFEYQDINYSEDINNDGKIYRFGPYVDWGVTEVISVRAGVALENAEFDNNSVITASSDDDSYTGLSGSVRVRHLLNEAFNHALEGYRRVSTADTSNFYIVDGLRHTSALQIFPRVRLDTLLSYEMSESSGGFLDDDFNRFEAGLSFNLVLGPRLTADVGYRYEDKDSDAAFRSYQRNRARILFQYDF